MRVKTGVENDEVEWEGEQETREGRDDKEGRWRGLQGLKTLSFGLVPGVCLRLELEVKPEVYLLPPGRAPSSYSASPGGQTDRDPSADK